MLVRSLAAFGGACAALAGCALAQGAGAPLSTRSEASEAPISRPVVVEMFLSQSCSSSPPAAEILADLAKRPDIVALAWHVDYWDQFAARDVGPWSDPFARAAFVERQMAYNKRIRGREMRMTPQAVIDGFLSVAGSKRDALEARIREAQFVDEKARLTPPALEVERAGGGIIRARIDDVGAPYDAIVVSFRRSAVTKVAGGDNAGVTFREVNVVRTVDRLASNHEGAGEFSFRAPGEGADCAVLVQERDHGRIVAARYCAGAAKLAANP